MNVSAHIDPVAVVSALHLTPSQARVASFLARNIGQWFPGERLVSVAWPGRDDGGPLDGVRSLVKRLRMNLAGSPLDIESQLGRHNTDRRMIWKPVRLPADWRFNPEGMVETPFDGVLSYSDAMILFDLKATRSKSVSEDKAWGRV